MRYGFEGWLIKFGNVILPNSYLLADGWESTPNQRLELDAYRDANMLLHRETSKKLQDLAYLKHKGYDVGGNERV